MTLWCVLQAQLLKDGIDLLLGEVEVGQLLPNALLLNYVAHERPGRSSRLEVLVVAHL